MFADRRMGWASCRRPWESWTPRPYPAGPMRECPNKNSFPTMDLSVGSCAMKYQCINGGASEEFRWNTGASRSHIVVKSFVGCFSRSIYDKYKRVP
eukprot:6351839-Amphidinium_carterae.1